MSVAPHLTLITEVMPVIRRDFPLVDTTILNPSAAIPLLDGEWLGMNSSNYQVERLGAGTEQLTPAWQVFAEKGRYDTQAAGKTTLLFLGFYEAETDVADNVAGGGYTVGGKLMVTNVQIGGAGNNYRGLKPMSATPGSHLTFGWITRLVGTTKIRYITHAGWPQPTTV